MHVHKLSNVEHYVSLLDGNADESQALFRDLLIGVTGFFRDPEAFETLAVQVVPKLFQDKGPADVVRIWVAGCATGEEAFTRAILCREHMEQLAARKKSVIEVADTSVAGHHASEFLMNPAVDTSKLPAVQIFATDIDDRSLNVGRTGAYPVGIAEDVGADRLERFFVKRGKKYHLTREIREMVMFSPHNLISDPPFSRQDLISCRNLLIYLGPHLQQKLMPLFHYALRPSGFLFLGPSETISTHRELFRVLDTRYRISQRKETAVETTAAVARRDQENGHDRTGNGYRALRESGDESRDLLQVMQRIVLDEFAPKAVVVNEDGHVLCASGDMQKYLSVTGGEFQNNIIRMARSGLRLGLQRALKDAAQVRRQVVHENLFLRNGSDAQQVMLTVQPMPEVGTELKALRASLEAEVCMLWLPDSSGEFLACVEVDTIDSTQQAFVDISRGGRFAPGEGLPGLAWKRRRPVWFADIQSRDVFVRGNVAAECRLNSGVATPIVVGRKFKGVFEVFTTRQLTREPEPLEMLAAVGSDIGQPLADVIIPQEFRDRHCRGIARFLAGGEAKVIGQRLELTALRADGRHFPVELAISVSHGRDGSPFFTGYLRDITERRQWAADLKDRESHLRRVIDNTLVFIGVLDVDGTLLETNATAIRSAGLDRSDVIGRKFWDCYWWDFDQESIARLQDAVRRAAAGEVVRYDVVVRMAGDTRITIDFLQSPVRDEHGRITHLIPSGVDISERKAAEAETQRQAKIERFLSRAGATLASSLDYRRTLSDVTHLCVPTLADWAFVDL